MENNELITKAQVKHLILQNSEDIDVDQAWRMLSDIKSVGTYEELEAYRTAEHDGTLLRLPCKVGDTVYTVDLDCEDNPEHTKMCFCWNKSCKSCEKAYLRVWENRTKTVNIRSIVAEMGLCGEYGGFGKTVFLTRAEADAALKEQEGQK